MSYQQQFHSRLLQQLNDTNCRNLELQSMLAQKDDQLSTLNTRLSNALVSPGASATGSDVNGSIGHLQRRNANTLYQLDRAQQALAAADGKLKNTTSRFHRIEADLRKQVIELQRELRHCHQQSKNSLGSSHPPRKSAQWPASTGVAPRAELDAANTEVKRLRSAYASLQKQFEQENKESVPHRGFPPADPEKSRHVEDQDDEETVPNLKQEPTDMGSAPVASGSAPRRLQQSLDPKPRRDSGNSLISAATKPKPPQPRKRSRSSGEDERPSPAKKARSELAEQLDSSSSCEVSEDDLNNDGEFSLDPAPVAPSLESLLKNSIIPHSDMIKDLQQRFEFQAVTQHYDSGDIDAFHSKEDLSDECEELWVRIKKQVDEWEEAKGEEWIFEFEKPGYRMFNPPCVTTKLKGKGGKMQWRAGCEGKFACMKCVEEERPCFTWNGGEFWLLPLHEEDRKWGVEDGSEIRYWFNVDRHSFFYHDFQGEVNGSWRAGKELFEGQGVYTGIALAHLEKSQAKKLYGFQA